MNHRSRFLLIVCSLLFIEWISSFQSCLAGEFKIIDIHRNIPLSDTDEVFKDYYITGGSRDGFKENQVVSVFRERMIKASEVSKETFTIQILVGKLRILSAQNGISIARLYDSMNFENSPFTDQPGIIVGDYVELKGAFVDTKKKIKLRDTERLDGQEEEKLDIDGIPLKDKKAHKDKVISLLEGKEILAVPQEASLVKPGVSTIKSEASVAKPQSSPTKVESTLAKPDLSRKEASIDASLVSEVPKKNEQNTDKKLTSEKTPGPEAHAEQ